MANYHPYERALLEKLSHDELKPLLASFEIALTEQLQPFKKSSHEYWKETNKIIEDLKNIGHDLWSWDMDGEKHLWGWNYMEKKTSGLLQIQFDVKGQVKVFWRDIDPRLGVTE